MTPHLAPTPTVSKPAMPTPVEGSILREWRVGTLPLRGSKRRIALRTARPGQEALGWRHGQQIRPSSLLWGAFLILGGTALVLRLWTPGHRALPWITTTLLILLALRVPIRSPEGEVEGSL